MRKQKKKEWKGRHNLVSTCKAKYDQKLNKSSSFPIIKPLVRIYVNFINLYVKLWL